MENERLIAEASRHRPEVDAASSSSHLSERLRTETKKLILEMKDKFESDLAKVQDDLDFMTQSFEDLQLELNEREDQDPEEEPVDELADILGDLRQASGLPISQRA